jgi:hypothetical protein
MQAVVKPLLDFREHDIKDVQVRALATTGAF